MNHDLFTQIKLQNIKLIQVQKKLTMGKVSMVHLLAGFATLLYCPQFSLDPFGVGHGLAHYFMSYGEWACGLFCGALFYGAGSIVSLFVLTKRDLLYFSYQNFKKSLIIVATFYFILMLVAKMNSTDLLHYGLEFSIAWIVGALAIQGLVNTAARPRLNYN